MIKNLISSKGIGVLGAVAISSASTVVSAESSPFSSTAQIAQTVETAQFFPSELVSTERSLNTQSQSCLLQPSFDVELSSEVQGIIKEMKVQRGDSVEAGQVVMTLKSTLEQAALNTVQARLEFATRKVKRNAELFKKNLISDTEQDEMLTEQRLAAYQLKEAKVKLSQRETTSPISGVVIERIKEPGEFVDETPFLRLATLNPMHAEVVLPAELYGLLHKGEQVSLKAIGSEKPHQGEIKIIDPVIDAASNTFAVTVSLNNDSGELSAGLRCSVDFLQTTL